MAPTKGPIGSAAAPTDDSDLEDLIAKSPTGKKLETINLEQLTHEEDDTATLLSRVGGIGVGKGGRSSFTPFFIGSLCHFLCGHLRLFFYHHPLCTKCLLTLSLLSLLAFLSNTLFNPTAPTGIMGGDYTAITSAYDLSLSQVHHWCIQGDNDSCKCENPLEATSRMEFKSWNAAHKANKADVEYYRANFGEKPRKVDKGLGRPRPEIDVAFLGESVVEAMDGRWLGKHVLSAMRGHPSVEGPEDIHQGRSTDKIFESLFRKDKGGPVEGLALGIAGDTCANVLWRIQHDEVPHDFNPKVWWLLLGMNDLTRMQCSEEITVLGILRVVEEIRLRKPDAKIVINSLLPMVNFQSEEQPKMADFADFTAGEGGGGKRGKSRKNEVPDTFQLRGDDGDVDGDEGDDDKRRVLRSNDPSTGSRHPLRTLYTENRDDDRTDRKRVPRNERDRKRTKKQRLRDQDEATEGPDLEEAIARRKKMLEARDKRVKDKVFADKEKYHPRKPINPLLPMIKRKQLPPVWPAVHLINDKLKEFCTKHESISFFDATPIFASDEGGGKHRLFDELISPRGHPTERGFAKWEGHIMSRLHKLLDWEVTEKKGKMEVMRVEEPKEEEDEEEGEGDEVGGITAEDPEQDGSEHVSKGKIAVTPSTEEPPTRDDEDTEPKVKSSRKEEGEDGEEEGGEGDGDEEGGGGEGGGKEEEDDDDDEE